MHRSSAVVGVVDGSIETIIVGLLQVCRLGYLTQIYRRLNFTCAVGQRRNSTYQELPAVIGRPRRFQVLSQSPATARIFSQNSATNLVNASVLKFS